MFDYFIIFCLAFYALFNYSKLFAKRKVGDMPGPFQIVTPDSFILLGLGPYLPQKIFGIEFLPNRTAVLKRDAYERYFKKYNSDIIAFKSPSTVQLMVASPDMAKTIIANKTTFPKNQVIWQASNVYGPHIASTESDEWKIHRKIAAPSFSEKNNRLVHDQTVKFCNELFQQLDAQPPEVVPVAEIMPKLTMHIVAAAGYGINIPLAESDAVPPGHKMPLNQTLGLATEKLYERHLFPSWIRKNSPMKFFSDLNTVYDELDKWLEEVLEVAYENVKNPLMERSDLIYSLVEASLGTGEHPPLLSRDSLKSDAFAFLVAGMYFFII
jgi:cytochrome P450